MVTKEILDKLNDENSVIGITKMPQPMMFGNETKTVEAVVLTVDSTPFFTFGQPDSMLNTGMDNIFYNEKHSQYYGNLPKQVDALVDLADKILNDWAKEHNVCDNVTIGDSVRNQIKSVTMEYLDAEFDISPNMKVVDLRRDIWSDYADNHNFYTGVVLAGNKLLDFDYRDGQMAVSRHYNADLTQAEERWLKGHMRHIENFVGKSVREEIAERDNRHKNRYGVSHND